MIELAVRIVEKLGRDRSHLPDIAGEGGEYASRWAGYLSAQVPTDQPRIQQSAAAAILNVTDGRGAADLQSLLMVLWETLNDRPMSISDSPASRRAMASLR